jgi:hypothetical protein
LGFSSLLLRINFLEPRQIFSTAGCGTEGGSRLPQSKRKTTDEERIKVPPTHDPNCDRLEKEIAVTINPYQATMRGQVAPRNQEDPMTLGCFYFFVGALVLNLSLLIASATYHRSLVEDVSIYTSSKVIRLEMVSMGISILAIPFLIMFCVFALALSRFSYALWCFALLIATGVLIGIAMLIDAPTLVYMT